MRRSVILMVLGVMLTGLVLPAPSHAEYCVERERVCDQKGVYFEVPENIVGNKEVSFTLEIDGDPELKKAASLKKIFNLKDISWLSISWGYLFGQPAHKEGVIKFNYRVFSRGGWSRWLYTQDKIIEHIEVGGVSRSGFFITKISQTNFDKIQIRMDLYLHSPENERYVSGHTRRWCDGVAVFAGNCIGGFQGVNRPGIWRGGKPIYSTRAVGVRNGVLRLGKIRFALPCAQETVTYDCKADDYINNCAALEQVEGCGQLSTTCTRKDGDGRCGRYRDTYRCGNPLGTAKGVIELPATHTISDEQLEGCTQEQANSSCQKTGRTCAEGRGTRNINGLDITRDCWRYEDTYTCLGDSTVDDCASLKAARECREEGNECLARGDAGRCLHWEHRYRCGGGAAAGSPVAKCGAQTYCVSGNCRSLDYSPNTNFALAVAWLNKLKAASEDFTGEPPKVFKGEGQSCKKAILGFENCCGDTGWGLTLGLASCRPEEKALARAMDQGQTHYVGTYCSQKAFFVCLAKKRVYCQFKSRLARVFQQQIRNQLGISWGAAKSPACRALTIDELQKVNWQQVDLRDVYQELLSEVQIPAEETVGKAIEQRVRDHMSKAKTTKPDLPPATSPAPSSAPATSPAPAPSSPGASP